MFKSLDAQTGWSKILFHATRHVLFFAMMLMSGSC